MKVRGRREIGKRSKVISGSVIKVRNPIFDDFGRQKRSDKMRVKRKNQFSSSEDDDRLEICKANKNGLDLD